MPNAPEDARQRGLRSRLRELGFDDVRFARVDRPAPGDPASPRSLPGWLAAGLQADMHWMERSLDKRLHPGLVLPGVRSVIMLGVSYWRGAATGGADGAPAPRWARYSLFEDYHDTMKPGLVAAGRVLEEIYGLSGTDYRYYVDTGPVLDRGWAARAGLGFIGNNAMLISPEHGNWLFIAAILTRLELAPDEPIRRRLEREPAADAPAPAGPDAAFARKPGETVAPPVGVRCGTCTRCLDACPTRAFVEPGVVDARRCISYQTIENKGAIPRDLRAGIGLRIYGCDVCLEVCPWNRFAQAGRQQLLSVRAEIGELPLAELLALTPERFAEVFRRTPIKRLKLAGLLRNACVVAGNSGDPGLLPQLVTLAASYPVALVRAHAVWAVHRLGGGPALAEAARTENDPLVLAEYAAASERRAGGGRDVNPPSGVT